VCMGEKLSWKRRADLYSNCYFSLDERAYVYSHSNNNKATSFLEGNRTQARETLKSRRKQERLSNQVERAEVSFLEGKRTQARERLSNHVEIAEHLMRNMRTSAVRE
jgi:hypothetical protein